MAKTMVVLVLVFLIALELQRTDADILDKLKKKSKDVKNPTPAPQTVIVTKKVYVPYPVQQPKKTYGHKPGGHGWGQYPQGGHQQYKGGPYGYGP